MTGVYRIMHTVEVVDREVLVLSEYWNEGHSIQMLVNSEETGSILSL